MAVEAFDPTREQAAAAVAEAGHRAAQVHRADRQLRWMLLAVLAVYLVAAVTMSVSPHRGSPVGVIVVVAAVLTGLVLAVVAGLRIRAYSRAGIITYFATIIAFNVWSSVVTSISIGTGFWGSGRPAYDFGITVGIAVLPLAVGAALMGRRR
ncbi:MAG TPA: hypothetical protein VFL27_11390 [Candidatus Dormibacteraeota bacterium]|nr:hypothetical protein [Candidatus Dormibacteraeota bacterium]